MACVLVVWHSMTGGAEALADALTDGASDVSIEGVDVVRRRALDAVRLYLVRVEHQVELLDADLVGERRHPVDDLPRRQTGRAPERLGEEDQFHRGRDVRERRLEIAWSA